MAKQDAMKQYANIQYLVQNEIGAGIDNMDLEKVFSAFKLPSHAHTGLDSPQVPYTNIFNADQYAFTQTRILTSAQILALKDSFVPLVLPPNANTVVIVNGITAKLSYLGTAYTGANSLEFRYTNASGAKVTTDLANTFINSSATTYAHAPAVTAAFTPVVGGSANNGQIVVCVPTANPAAGTGTITFNVHYRIVPLLT